VLAYTSRLIGSDEAAQKGDFKENIRCNALRLLAPYIAAYASWREPENVDIIFSKMTRVAMEIQFGMPGPGLASTHAKHSS